jgi:DNA-binding NarL/FixJ family response regulator
MPDLADRRSLRENRAYASPAVTKLVVIDDHEALRGGLELLLEQAGHEVVGAASNVAAGLDLLVTADPDLALVDARLPDGSGIDLTRELLARDPRLAVILYTGEAGAELVRDALDAGVRGYVLKTADLAELLEAVEAVAGGGSYLDPRLPPLDAAGPVSRLSPREREIMHLMAEGLTAEQIGTRLSVSVETVRTHVRNAIRKLQARNRVHAIALALERGEIALDDGDDGNADAP